MANKKKRNTEQYRTFVENVVGLSDNNFNDYPTIYETDFFDMLVRNGITFDDVKNDKRDHASLVKQASASDKAKLQIALFFKMGYNSYMNNVNKAWADLKITDEEDHQVKPDKKSKSEK